MPMNSWLKSVAPLIMVGGLTLADSDIKQAPEMSKKEIDPCAEAMARVRMRGWTATLDQHCIPVNLQGFLYGGQKGGNRVEEAYSFFESNKDIFRMENPRKELVLRGQSGDELGQFIVFDQAVNGVKVQSAYYSVHFKPDGMMWEIVGHINSEARQVNTTPAISEKQAKEIVCATIQDREPPPTPKDAGSSGPIICRPVQGGQLHLAWIVRLDTLRYYVDAHNGEIFQKEPAFIH